MTPIKELLLVIGIIFMTYIVIAIIYHIKFIFWKKRMKKEALRRMDIMDRIKDTMIPETKEILLENGTIIKTREPTVKEAHEMLRGLKYE